MATFKPEEIEKLKRIGNEVKFDFETYQHFKFVYF